MESKQWKAGDVMKYKSVYELNQANHYIMQMRPILHKEALFCDGSKDYRMPVEPNAYESVQIRFRTAKDNVDSVLLWSDGKSHFMDVVETENEFDYYEVTVQLHDKPYFYYFEIVTGMLHCFYGCQGVSKNVDLEQSFCIVPGFSTPEWSKGAVMYQIFVDRFYNGDTTNDVLTNEYYYLTGLAKKVEFWDKYPEGYSIHEFYGGDLKGIYDKLDYLQDLGVEVLYLNPIFVSPSSHKYDIQDYDHVDPHFGKIVEDNGELLSEKNTDNRLASKYRCRVTREENLKASDEVLIQLIDEIHKRGMRIILDGVFNHCGSFHKWINREGIYSSKEGYPNGAFWSKDSEYRSYFSFSHENEWPGNGSYESWWENGTLPKLNYEGSKELTQYILDIGKKWVSPPFNADGWRLDVAADLGHSIETNHNFWKQFRKAVKEANPQAIILAEHYGMAKDWLLGDEWDSLMNYDAFMEPVSWFLTGMEKHSDAFMEDKIGNAKDFEEKMRYGMNQFLTSSLLSAMNQLSNHDHSRFLTRTNHKIGRAEELGAKAANEEINKGIFREAVVMQMTWPGAPTLYYGDEAGLCGFTDPDNRRTYPWGKEDADLIEFHKEIIRIHKSSPAFKTGSFKMLYVRKNVLCYARFTRKEQFLIMLNNDIYAQQLDVSFWPAGTTKHCKTKQLIFTNEGGYTTMPVYYSTENGRLKITMQRRSAIVLSCEDIKDDYMDA